MFERTDYVIVDRVPKDFNLKFDTSIHDDLDWRENLGQDTRIEKTTTNPNPN